MGASEVTFERTNPELRADVLVIQAVSSDNPDSPDLSHPLIGDFCGKLGIDTGILAGLLKQNPDFSGLTVTGPEEFPITNENGDVAEEVRLWIADLPGIGQTEVSINRLYPAATKWRDATSSHRITRDDNQGDFEIMYGLAGEFVLTLPDAVQPVDGVPRATAGRDDIYVSPGTLVIIPAPRANGWVKVTSEPCSFVYVCNPPWNQDLIVPTPDSGPPRPRQADFWPE
ncbi:hypothetical protein A2Z33_00235 [Candidatus Gottesmanbacteria bacterium RBG_16_52_11]|uniref:Uncharacterized protein n=1 Tax=Candidatus Gottesmanbacteria bacterium RBG_16_52_11 TaxID=1798374 RepID=A0A1F5YNS9_9BACT|nr:MAG: hypothetical protein A2Z33_00235 [Candidatus Gottesmanbacteria bacterium RBG_16_52_11]